MSSPPRGTVTFLFTDIAGSTRLWQDHPVAMAQAQARHDNLVRGVAAHFDGLVYKTIGDAFQVAFATAPAAVGAAVALQTGLADVDWSSIGLGSPLLIRAAVHSVAADPDTDGDYRSPALNRLGRLLAAGHGGQILLTESTMALMRGVLPAGVAAHDLGLHRLKDLLEPERIVQLVVPGLDRQFPRLRTLDAHLHSLPIQPTPFLGRDGDTQRVSIHLRDPSVRLVTLTGPGGIGKTRLGLQVAAELVADFEDGVFFVALGHVSDAALVTRAIADVLGLHETGERSITDVLHDYLRTKRLLLMLDNLEQVVAAAPALAELLTAAPGLKVLATSRLPLRLQAEHEIPVAPLALPRRKPPPSLQQVSQYDAVQLFVSRAQAVKPDFAIDNESAPAVAEICHRLDGLPLAIELAAARTRLLPPRALLARLEWRLPLLVGGATDLPERQRTLRATITWSYDLLDAREQSLFRRLSVFTGGWTIEAAEAVAASPVESDLFVLDGLERLVAHNLIRQVEGPDGEPRFTMLQTIREFGSSQLEAGDEGAETRQRHADYFTAYSEAADLQFRTDKVGTAIQNLEREHDNLRTALGWVWASGNVDSAIQLAGALSRFWEVCGYLTEGRAWIEKVLGMGGHPPAGVLARAMSGAGYMAYRQGELEIATRQVEDALHFARSVDDTERECDCLNILGILAGAKGEHGSAVAYFDASLAVARQLNDPYWMTPALTNLGIAVIEQGELDRGLGYFEESLQIDRRLGVTQGIALSLVNLGEGELTRGNRSAAAAYITEAFHELRALGSQASFLGEALTVAGCLAAEGGQLETAARIFGTADTILESQGVVYEAWTAQIRRRTEQAVYTSMGSSAFADSYAAGQLLSVEDAIAEVLSAIRT